MVQRMAFTFLGIDMDFDLTQVSLTSIVTVIGSTGVLSAVCTHLFSMFREWRKDQKARARTASYAALRLSVMLETYAMECARRIEEVKTSLFSNGAYGKIHDRLPDLPSYPEDIDWQSLEPSLVDEVLSFPSLLLVSNDISTFFADGNLPEEPEGGTAVCLQHCGCRGIQALKIATQLRRQYGLKVRNALSDNWNMLQCLEVEEAKYHEHYQRLKEWKDNNFANPDN